MVNPARMGKLVRHRVDLWDAAWHHARRFWDCRETLALVPGGEGRGWLH